ncbi:MAG: DUF6673 family protein [Ruthenibacterium sp.]
MKTITINNVALPFDSLDADVLDTVHVAIKTMNKEIQRITDAPLGESDKIRAMCAGVRACFDAIFGNGTGLTVCGNRDNIGICNSVFAEFITIMQKQGDEFEENTKRQLDAISGS